MAAATLTEPEESSALVAFEVHLENFSGPFDLLLGLIGKHQLDITEVALAAVTDEFIEYIRAAGTAKLDETSQFLVVAATLLDLKAARLLPAGEVEDDEDIALLEARDLLFARLLQYRAFKDVASELAVALENGARRSPRAVPLEPQLAELLPDLIMNVTPEALAALAARALTPKAPAEVGLEHLHSPAVSVRDEAKTMLDRLDRHENKALSFRHLIADADNGLVVVVRFLALLELYRDLAISFDQAAALGELTIRLRGPVDSVDTDKFDEFDASSDESSDESSDASDTNSPADD